MPRNFKASELLRAPKQNLIKKQDLIISVDNRDQISLHLW